jgi:hypothetical protein
MKISYRKYNKNDYNGVIDFFRNLYRESSIVPFWLLQRWEYSEFFVSLLHKHRGSTIDWKDTIYLWETATEGIVAVLCSESPDENIYIHIKSNYRFLEDEIINIAENKVVSELLNKPNIRIWCQEGDKYRESLLQQKGYIKGLDVEYLNWRNLEEDLPEFKLPEGYTIHDMVNEEGLNLQQKIIQITAAFNSDPYPNEIYRNLQRGQSYRKKFDLYTTESDGNVCSFCIIWFDEELNIGYFEPVGTAENHRLKGLGRGTLNVGLKLLKEAGATMAFVGASGDERMSFYKASGFNNRIAFHPWAKTLGSKDDSKDSLF